MVQNNNKFGVFKTGFSIFRALQAVFVALKIIEVALNFILTKCVRTLQIGGKFSAERWNSYFFLLDFGRSRDQWKSVE